MLEFVQSELGENGQILAFKLSGRLDALQVDYLYSVLENRIRDGHSKIILDCHEMEYISSMGLGMLMRVHAKMRKQSGDVKLARVHGAVADVLSLTRLDRVLQMYPTLQEAIDSFNAGASR